MPRLEEYRWLRVLCAASDSFSTASSGDGMSGFPKPRSITSLPARRASIFRPLMIENTYGGRLSMRLNCMAATLPVRLCQHGDRLEDPDEQRGPTGLHLRGDRDPARQSEQVRDR